jgi:uroporphyrin-III C-methyltransferase
MSGIVYLVGAGPGDPRLLTLRGAEVLQRADVVVYDRLAPAALLDLAPRGAERVDAGKARGRVALSQEAINRVLVDRGRRGLEVVRLKGGDPFVFGRGGEEALALADAGVPFEVVPGVSAAVAAPAYAGIPVTQRGMAAS